MEPQTSVHEATITLEDSRQGGIRTAEIGGFRNLDHWRMEPQTSVHEATVEDRLEEEEGPRWANLIIEALAEVFSRLPCEVRLNTVPLVCKSWKAASCDPVSWRTVDLRDWFRKNVEADLDWESECETRVEFLVKKVVDRSRGQLRELRAMHCSDAGIEYLAERCHSLTVLSIPDSLLVTDKSVKKLATNCRNLQELDVSDCYNISNQALEAIGRNCTSLVWLGRNMLRRKFYRGSAMAPGPNSPGGDEEAIVVSKHMGKLKHLEMKRTSLSDFGLVHLARGCGKLESLNLACCSALSPRVLDGVSLQWTNLKEFTKPITPRIAVNPNPANFSWMMFN